MYLGGLAKNRKAIVETSANQLQEICLDKLAESLPGEAFIPVQLKLDKPKTVWVTTTEVKISRLEGKRSIAIVMNALTFSQATDIDYFITNVSASIITLEWIVTTYSKRR
ncbi:MAG: hypothetical protein F6K28_37985 [Microcoleus sp. SIO2G3]|nr:hypothetical protein [Microcoleus sp. SIO2G3]